MRQSPNEGRPVDAPGVGLVEFPTLGYDFIVDEAKGGTVVLLEVNTNPGMVRHRQACVWGRGAVGVGTRLASVSAIRTLNRA